MLTTNYGATIGLFFIIAERRLANARRVCLPLRLRENPDKCCRLSNFYCMLFKMLFNKWLLFNKFNLTLMIIPPSNNKLQIFSLSVFKKTKNYINI